MHAHAYATTLRTRICRLLAIPFVGGHAVTVQVLLTSRSSQNPVMSNKVTVIIALTC